MVSTFTQPNYNDSSQSGSAYPVAIDAAVSVMKRLAAQFAPHQNNTGSPDAPDMTVRLDAGSVFNPTTRVLTEVAAQSTAALTAPTVNPRYDIVYVDKDTGAVGVATGAEAASPSDPSIPADKLPVARIRWTVGMAQITNTDLDDIRVLNVPPADQTIPRAYIAGLKMSNAADTTNDITVAAGQAVNSDNSAFVSLAAAITKQLDAVWASGTTAGGRFDTSISDGVWGVYLISNGSSVDVGFSKNTGDPTGEANYPSGYTQYRRIGYIVRSTSILQFTDRGNGRIDLSTSVEDFDGTIGNSRSLITTTCPPDTLGRFRVNIFNTGAAVAGILQPTAETDGVPTGAATPGTTFQTEAAGGGCGWEGEVWVDSSRQVAARASVATTDFQLVCAGWTDNRGRDD